MNIYLNEKLHQTNVTTLRDLILELGVPFEGLAVAVNSRIVSRSDWGFFNLEDGAKIVLINATRGG